MPPADDPSAENAGTSPSGVTENGEGKSFLAAVFDDRIVTIPNILTLGRLVAIPVFLYLLFGLDEPIAAAALIAVLGATDWFDGKIARRYDQISELGKLLDPAADRILLMSVIVAITVYGSVPVWFAVPILVREPLMFAAVVVLGILGAKRIDVTFVGKAGTFAMMVAFPLFLLATDSDATWADVVELIAWTCGLVGLALSLYATVTYVPMARRALAEGRAERAG